MNSICYINNSHGDEDSADYNSSPYRVSILDERFSVVDVRSNVKEEEANVWWIEIIRRRKIIETHQR